MTEDKPTTEEAVGQLLSAVILLFLIPWGVQLTWNWSLVQVLHIAEISYWQAFWLTILSNFLFKHNSTK